MTATDEMLGIMPPIIVAGAATNLAKTMFPEQMKQKTRTRTVYKTKYVTRKSKTKSKSKKGSWAKGRPSKASRVIRKYL